MVEWAQEAGLISGNVKNQLKVVYEPDCASLSILHEINQKTHEREQLKAAQNIEQNKNEIIANDNSNEFKSFFECGNPKMCFYVFQIFNEIICK